MLGALAPVVSMNAYCRYRMGAGGAKRRARSRSQSPVFTQPRDVGAPAMRMTTDRNVSIQERTAGPLETKPLINALAPDLLILESLVAIPALDDRATPR